MEINGTVDEAQAVMGVARSEAVPDSELDRLLTALERELYVLMAEVATDPAKRSKLEPGTTLVTTGMVEALEEQIDGLTGRFEMPADFVVPGATRASAALDLARTDRAPGRAAVRLLPDRGFGGGPVPQPVVRPVVGHGPLGRGRAPSAGPGHSPARSRLVGRRGRARRWGGRRGGPPGPRRTNDVNIETLAADSLPAGLTAVGVPVVSVDSGPRPVAGTGQVAGAPIPTAVDPEWCKRHGFSAKVGQTLTFRASGPTARARSRPGRGGHAGDDGR